MKIDSVDFFYLALPEVLDIGDGSQDALLVRIRAGSYEGWGECEASPVTSIASFYCPMSHSACHPVQDAVLGQTLDSISDIYRIHANVHRICFDLLQADHTLSGIDIALWDLMGKRSGVPVFQLLGYEQPFPKLAYASQLFGNTPEETLQKAVQVKKAGYRAAKFGWGPYGTKSVKEDAAQVEAAREGLGKDLFLFVDAGTVWGEDVEAASQRLPALESMNVSWLEEPFTGGALHAYKELSLRTIVPLAGGEGSHNALQARHLMDFAGVGFIQIDTGRIGGISSAFETVKYACQKEIKYVNHTFTTHLALSASLQPYAGLSEHMLCEYPVEASILAAELTNESIKIDENGHIHLPQRAGLGMTLNKDTILRFIQDVELRIGNKIYYRTPGL